MNLGLWLFISSWKKKWLLLFQETGKETHLLTLVSSPLVPPTTNAPPLLSLLFLTGLLALSHVGHVFECDSNCTLAAGCRPWWRHCDILVTSPSFWPITWQGHVSPAWQFEQGMLGELVQGLMGGLFCPSRWRIVSHACVWWVLDYDWLRSWLSGVKSCSNDGCQEKVNRKI